MHASREIFVVEPFRLHPDRRLLVANGVPVILTPRAYDVLEFLVRNRDRIVTREEIVAHVWRGVTVGENNLSVQMSALRHALAESSGKKQLIVNIPGRGYRFVVEVDVDVELNQSPAGEADHPEQSRNVERPPEQPPKRSRLRRLIMLTLIASIFVAIGSIVEIMKVMSSASQSVIATRRDLRLSIGVGAFTAIGGDAGADVLAVQYRTLVLSNLAIFPDLKVYPDIGTTVTPRFKVTGSIAVDGRTVKPEITVQQAPGWQSIDNEVGYPPEGATASQHAFAVTQMIAGIRPSLFKAEHALRGSHPPDALDLLIDAQLAASDMDDPTPVTAGIALARQALAKDPGLTPAKAFLALLLADSVQLSVAATGDPDARLAEELIQDVLHQYPANPMYIGFKAYILLTLEREDEAEITLKRGLKISPGYYSLEQLLVAAFMMTDQLAEAGRNIADIPSSSWNDRPAYLSYLNGEFKEALSQIDSVLVSGGKSWGTGFTKLFKVAIQMKLGRDPDARKTLQDALHELAPAFRHASALRRCYYALPPGAWSSFVQDLKAAGMPP